MKMTKDELLMVSSKFETENKILKQEDERIRKEFSKQFGWKEVGSSYGTGKTDFKIPTWEEIFTKVGKLLALKDFYDLEGNVSEHECAIEEIRNNLNDIKMKNLNN